MTSKRSTARRRPGARSSRVVDRVDCAGRREGARPDSRNKGGRHLRLLTSVSRKSCAVFEELNGFCSTGACKRGEESPQGLLHRAAPTSRSSRSAY